jgi:midasin
MVKVMENL